jgi:acid phosphatase family membrane protein YuiD
MDYSYLVTPLLAWLVAGSLKFLINSIRTKQLAFGLIGYGGLPSTHSAIVSSTAALVAFREGLDHPAFGVAVALLFIVILDAGSLRRQVGQHAAHINQLLGADAQPRLRERMGHSRLEIAAGLITGIVVAAFVVRVFPTSFS